MQQFKESLTFVQISDMFHFSSPAYFSRYVQRTIGLNPPNTANSQHPNSHISFTPVLTRGDLLSGFIHKCEFIIPYNYRKFAA